jgi:crossover junction endodeoxyribonuclease RusA
VLEEGKVSNRIVVEIPLLPPKEVSPNYHGKLRARMRATKAWREAAYYCARNACPGVFPNYEKAVVRVTYQVPSQVYIKDDDNAIASVKAALDGCVLAGIIRDDSPEHLRVLQVIWDIGKEKDKATLLEFIKLEEG